MGWLERLVARTFDHPALVWGAVLALIAFGLVSWRGLSVEAFPDLTNQQVVIATEAPGLAADDVAQWITFPIEAAVMGIPGTEQVRSTSKFGLSLVTVVFEDRVPIYFARQQVAERLNEVRGRLPAGFSPTLGPVATPFGEVYQYLVEGPLDPMARKTLQDWDVRLRLRSVAGVSEVNSWGGFSQCLEVTVDPRRLEAFQLPFDAVLAAVRNNNAAFGGGFLEHRAERLTLRGRGMLHGLKDLEQVVLHSHAGVPILLGDVAEIRTGAMPRHGAVTRDGQGETVSGMVILLKGENAAAATQRVKKRVAEINATLPSGVRIEPFYDQSEIIQRTSATVRKNLLEGCALVVLVLVVFLRDWRAALLVASVIPLALLCGFSSMFLFGISANLMSLGAIDFGLIVDGAVVMTENLVRRRTQHLGGEWRAVCRAAAAEVARPVTFGVLILFSAYLPILTLEGIAGKLYRPMALTVCSAILGALLLSLTAIPVAGQKLLARASLQDHEREAAWFLWLQTRYERILHWVLEHRRRVWAVALALVTSGLASLPFLGTDFMPKLDEGSILIQTRLMPSVSLEESVRFFTRVEKIVLSFPEVKRVVSKIGRPDIATEAMGVYEGDMYVLLQPEEKWQRRSKDELLDALAGALATIPGASFNFTQPMAMRLDEVISGIKGDVAVKIFGPDPKELQRLAQAVAQVLEQVPGVADLRAELISGARELSIALDRSAMARFGVSVEQVRAIVEAASGGTVVTEVLDGTRRFPVVVRLPAEYRREPQALAQLPLQAPGGERFLLGQIARIETSEAPEAVYREDGQRRIVVQANVRGRDLGSFVQEAHERIARSVSLPPGYYLRWGGQFENQERAMRRLAIVVPIALSAIALLLYNTFGNVRHALVVLVGIPFGLIGGIGALWVRGLHLNLAASVGFLALFGVAVLNGVVLISAINRLRAAGDSLRQATTRGASQRLKPVLMTALVAAFGFLPMALSRSAGAEIQRPLASVVIGGVFSSMILTLLVLPSLYEWVEQRRQAKEQR